MDRNLRSGLFHSMPQIFVDCEIIDFLIHLLRYDGAFTFDMELKVMSTGRVTSFENHEGTVLFTRTTTTHRKPRFFRGTVERERNRNVIMGDVTYDRIVLSTHVVVKDFVLRANDKSSQTVILEATFIGMRETSGLQNGME